MLTRIVLALSAFAATPVLAHATQPLTPAPAPAPKEDLVPVAIDTSLGRIVVALDRGRAPITTANFLHYVDTHRFDGQNFYRAMHMTAAEGGGGLIQGGITTDARKLYPPIAHEPTSQTGLHNVVGAISMAANGPGTARADFFILVSDMPGLDANGPGGDANGFAAFGHVTEGMDVVNKIWNASVSATKGDGAMKGQMLDPPIKIIRAERVNDSRRESASRLCRVMLNSYTLGEMQESRHVLPSLPPFGLPAQNTAPATTASISRTLWRRAKLKRDQRRSAAPARELLDDAIARE